MSAARVPLLAALFGLVVAGPAAAACQDQIAELQDRVARLNSEGADEQSTTVTTSEGEVEVEADAEGAEPQENWFEQSPSPEAAEQQLDAARTAARNGDEEMCQQHIEQTRKMIDALEG